MRLRALLLVLAILTCTASNAPSWAQLPAAEPKAEETPRDPYGRDSPRGLAEGLISALADEDYARAANYFDLGRLPSARRQAQGAAHARQLQHLLDSGGSLAPFIAISNNPQGEPDDGLPLEREKLGELPHPDGRLPLLAVLGESDGQAVWRISPANLGAAKVDREGQTEVELRELLPSALSEHSLGGAPIADWLILLLIGCAFYAVVRLVFTIGLVIVGRATGRREVNLVWRLVHAASSPLSLYLSIVLFMLTAENLQLAIVARQLLSRGAAAAAFVSMAWFLWRLLDVVADIVSARLEKGHKRRARAAVVFARRFAKILLLALAGIALLDAFGINVTTGIAALGLGGLALALGAQKSVENFVGSVSVLADEPVRVGDYCRVGDIAGTVEDIGIRSTRIRTLERTVVTIPNGALSSLQIENFALRDDFLFNVKFPLALDLGLAGIDKVLISLREMLAGSEDLREGARASLINLGPSGAEVELFAYIKAPDNDAAIEIRERLLLDILARIEGAQGRFAYPPRALHVEAVHGLSKPCGEDDAEGPVGPPAATTPGSKK